MKLVIQRVKKASIEIEDKIVGEIALGMVVFVAVEENDNEETIDKVIQKLLKLRIFSDSSGKMNLSVKDVGGGVLLVSQFTLNAKLNKGHRPSFHMSVEPKIAEQLYQNLIKKMQKIYQHVAQGVFAANMLVSLENDGPVTFLIDIE